MSTIGWGRRRGTSEFGGASKRSSKTRRREEEKPELTDHVLSLSLLFASSSLCPFRCCRYLILDVLGQGTFGQVVKCQNMKTNEVVAVKVIKNKPAYFNQSMMEVAILDEVSA